MSKLNMKKLFPLFLAFSIVVIVAGAILYGLLGYNTAPDKVTSYELTVSYRFNIEGEVEDTFLGEVEKTLEKHGLTFTSDKEEAEKPNSGSTAINPTSFYLTRYVLSGSEETLAQNADKALAEIRAYIANNEAKETDSLFWAEATADLSEIHNIAFHEAAWRGAIAIAVGTVVALVYVAIRYGVSAGVAGFVVCAHDALFTAAFFAIARIPVFAAAPVLYAAIAAFVSAVVWIVFASRLRASYKESPEQKADQAVENTLADSWKFVLIVIAVFAAVVVVLGAVAVSGVRALLLPAVLGTVIPAYSTLLIGPSVFAPIRKAFDKKRASKKVRYIGKKKKAETESEE